MRAWNRVVSVIESDHLVSLERSLAWLQQEILAPHVGGAAERPPSCDLVRSSASLAPAERVRIYSTAYFKRLRGCLAEDYPAVLALLGEDGFDDLCRRYLRRYTSRSFTLNPLGWRLPCFLAEAGDDEVPRRPLILDVARLETAISRVFDAPSADPLEPASLSGVPEECWPDARLRFVPALEVLAFDHPANAIATAVRQGTRLPPLEPRATWCAVYRREYRVWRCDLVEARYVLLAALVRGEPLGHAVQEAASAWEGPEVEVKIRGWMADWASEGLFTAVETVAG